MTKESPQYNSKDVSVSQRQIYILSLLSENPKGYREEEIQERLKNWDIEVSKRTITRDIDELSLNYGICEEERNGKTYYYADKYTLKNVDLTIEDLASLAFTKEILKEYKHLDMGQHAISFIEKIVETSTSLNQLQFEEICGQFKQGRIKNGNTDEVNVDTEKKIKNAIDNCNKVKIEYYSYSSDQSSKRIIHPYRMLLLDSYLCVEGYCESRKEIRRFRLSRMQMVDVLDEKFDAIEKDNLQEDTFFELSGEYSEEIELLFTGESIRYIKEYEAKRAKRIEEEKEGLYFYQTAPVAPDVIRWIRGFGPEVTVIKPKWLGNQLKKEAEQYIKKE